MSLSAAQMSLRSAHSSFESRRYDSASDSLDRALEFLAELPVDETAVIHAEIATLRAAVDEAVATEEAERMIRAAKMQLRRVESELDQGYDADYVLTSTLAKADEFLKDVPARFTADIMGEIRTWRDRLSGNAPASADAPAPVVEAPPSNEDDRIMLSQANGKIRSARSYVESRRYEWVDGTLDEAVALLTDVAGNESLLAEVAGLRAEAAQGIGAEHAQRLESELSRHFSTAEETGDWISTERTLEGLHYLTRRLSEQDVRTYLSAERVAELEARVATATTRRLAAIKARGLEGALPALAELESQAAADPFAGLDESAAYRVSQELQSMKSRVHGRLWSIAADWNAQTAADDPDVQAIDARIAEVDRKIAESSTAWSTALQVARVETQWVQVAERIEDWEADTFEINQSFPLHAPELSRTRAARRETEWLLGDSTLQEIRAQLPDHPAIIAAFDEAKRINEAATAKLAQAYHQVLDNAETLETPVRPDDRHEPVRFMNDAEAAFKDTPHQEGLVSRARALHERFEAEYAAIIQARQELWDKLMVDGDALWPSVVESTGAGEADPTDEESRGKTVLLRGVYNRAGWEWGGFSFAMSWNGVPIAGDYAPNVLAALEHAWYELQFSHAAGSDGPAVNDRLEWDVIAVVKGKGRVTERTTIVRRDQYGNELGTEEQWLPADGVVLDIIGLHAGPVAVGPNHDWAPAA
jgi:hypothetical protein